MGGVSILLFGIIASCGAQVLINNKIDFSVQRNLIIGSVILVIGIGDLAMNFGPIQLSGMALAAIIGILLHLILPDKEASYGPSKNDEVAIEVQEKTKKETAIQKKKAMA